MEQIQDFLASHLPANLLSAITTHSSTYYRIYSAILSARSFVAAFLDKTVNPLLTRLVHSPDVASVVLLVLLLFVSLKLLDLLRKAVVFWVRVFVRLALWSVVLGVALWVWNRGLDGAEADLKWVGQEWSKEYEGWKRRAEMAKVEARMRGGGVVR